MEKKSVNAELNTKILKVKRWHLIILYKATEDRVEEGSCSAVKCAVVVATEPTRYLCNRENWPGDTVSH